ncbi:MAG: c-type cytochrome [Verrucomicrobia bacterium]|nr:c-type cytochrome [Verrucomicrobiota bacterium]
MKLPPFKSWSALPAVLFLTASYVSAAEPEPESLPVAPEDALELIHVPEGFEVELVVAEPDVIDPVAFTWGADGRLWVAEMADYPMGMDGEGKPGGRVRWLRDTNNDGRYDQSVVFAEGLDFPTGILPWKKGVLVTAAPLIVYLEDSDGDGVADVQQPLFEGFHEGNQQLRVNGLIRGLDNWIYCASGAHTPNYGADTRIKSLITGKEIALGSRDFRFNPETGELDPQSGPSQFGRNRDDWGNWFGEMNSYPLWHYVLQDHYIRRNPHAASPDPRKQLVLPRNPMVYPFKALQKRFHNFQETGRFTSACGGMVYRDGLLFPESDLETIDSFTCEPFGNLVQHNRSFSDGVSFTVSLDGPVEVKDGVDFFASKDRWSRPVMARTGPDGALWIADMYRYMIEHPQWLPKEGQDELKPFYRLGDDRGRIYRVYRKERKPHLAPNLQKMTSLELVSALENRNGWQRDTAQALLVEQNDRAAIPELMNMATASKQPLARLHALCTLQGMGALNPAILKSTATDSSAGVRRHVVRLSEPWVNDYPDLQETLLNRVDDNDAKVRMQLAYSLGEWNGEAAAKALGRLAFADGTDLFMAAAIISSVNADNLMGVLVSLLAERSKANHGGELLGPLLALAVAYDNHDATMRALDAVLNQGGDPEWQYVTATSLLDALDRRRTGNQGMNDMDSNVMARVKALLASARRSSLDSDSPKAQRIAAIRLMAREEGTRASDIQALGSLLGLKTPVEIQVATVSHLGTLSGKQVPEVLMNNWISYSPSIRTEVLNVMTSRTEWLTTLLDEIESGNVALTDLDAAIRQLLITHSDDKIQARAKELMPTANVDRLRAVQKYQGALELKSDKERGKVVFRNFCFTCHKLDGVGIEIGPNLASLTDRNPASLLSGILDPNAVVEGKYSSYLATLKDGRVFLGILISETGANITIKDLANQEHVILRSELVSLTNTGKSLMPDGLETSLTQQNLADVIAYVAEAK